MPHSGKRKPEISQPIKKLKSIIWLNRIQCKQVVKWECHVYKSNEGRYDIILGRDLLTVLGLDSKMSEHVITVGDGPYKGYTDPMLDKCTYDIKT